MRQDKSPLACSFGVGAARQQVEQPAHHEPLIEHRFRIGLLRFWFRLDAVYGIVVEILVVGGQVKDSFLWGFSRLLR